MILLATDITLVGGMGTVIASLAAVTAYLFKELRGQHKEYIALLTGNLAHINESNSVLGKNESVLTDLKNSDSANTEKLTTLMGQAITEVQKMHMNTEKHKNELVAEIRRQST